MTKQLTKKPKEPSEKVKRAIALKLTRPDLRQYEIAKEVGIAPESLSRALRRDETRQYYERAYRQERSEYGKDALAALLGLLNADDESVRLKAVQYYEESQELVSQPRRALSSGNGAPANGLTLNISISPEHKASLAQHLDSGQVIEGESTPHRSEEEG